MITKITEKEQQLANILRTTTEALQAVTAERDALKANLHQVSLSHTHLHAENKVLRAAGEFELAGYALPDSAFDGMVIRKQKLSSDSIALYTRKQS